MHGIDDSDKCKSESVDTLIQNHRQLYLSLVQKNGRALKDLPVRLRNDKLIVLAAVQQYGNTLKHASSELQEDPEIVLAAVTQYGSALQYTARLHRGDEDIVLAAATPSVKAFAAQDGRAFQHATTKLRTNRKFVLAAAKRNGWILQSAPDTLRDDPKVVKTAVTQDGRVLRYASRNMRGAYDIVFAAVTQNGRALRCASEKLRNHREIVCIAVAQNAQALQYASPELRESLATELVVARDRRIAHLENKIKMYESNELDRGYSVLKESFTEHSDMKVERATTRRTVHVHDVKFSHRSIKRRFDDGRSFANLVEQLRRDEVHPLRDSFLRLRVWYFRGKLISRDNRRLYCLKKYQQERSENVMVMIDIVKLGKEVEKFVSSWTSRNGGESVRVRGNR